MNTNANINKNTNMYMYIGIMPWMLKVCSRCILDKVVLYTFGAFSFGISRASAGHFSEYDDGFFFSCGWGGYKGVMRMIKFVCTIIFSYKLLGFFLLLTELVMWFNPPYQSFCLILCFLGSVLVIFFILVAGKGLLLLKDELTERMSFIYGYILMKENKKEELLWQDLVRYYYSGIDKSYVNMSNSTNKYSFIYIVAFISLTLMVIFFDLSIWDAQLKKAVSDFVMHLYELDAGNTNSFGAIRKFVYGALYIYFGFMWHEPFLFIRDGDIHTFLGLVTFYVGAFIETFELRMYGKFVLQQAMVSSFNVSSIGEYYWVRRTISWIKDLFGSPRPAAEWDFTREERAQLQLLEQSGVVKICREDPSIWWVSNQEENSSTELRWILNNIHEYPGLMDILDGYIARRDRLLERPIEVPGFIDFPYRQPGSGVTAIHYFHEPVFASDGTLITRDERRIPYDHWQSSVVDTSNWFRIIHRGRWDPFVPQSYFLQRPPVSYLIQMEDDILLDWQGNGWGRTMRLRRP